MASPYDQLLAHPAAKAPTAPAKDTRNKSGEKFVMCPPRYLSTRVKNNVWMKGEKIDVPRALSQFRRIKHVIQSLGVTVFEIPPVPDAQDQVYVANIGISIEPYIILAKFSAPGRDQEIAPARTMFESMGYDVIQPPFDFEGEADLKLWKPGVYFGGVGQFSEQRAFDWISQKAGVQIIPITETDPRAFHEDCCLFVIDEGNILVNRDGIDAKSLKTLESLANVIVAPKGLGTTGITNGVLIRDKRIFLSGTFNPEIPDYRKSMEWLFETMDKFGITVVLCDCDEFDKSGADLSCSIMHLTF